MAVLAVVTAMFTMVGGFAGVAYADIIQSTIKILGCALMLVIGLYKVGGWHGLMAKVPDAMHIHKPYTDPDYPFWGIILVGLYGGIFYWGVDQVNVQRVLGRGEPQAGPLGRDVLRAAETDAGFHFRPAGRDRAGVVSRTRKIPRRPSSC